MAEENGVDSSIRDPFRRRLLSSFNSAQADSGNAPSLITSAPEGDPLSTGVGGSEFTSADTGIRQSILAQSNAAFQDDLRQVQDNAERKRQTRSGVTSQNELQAARSGQARRIGMLGQFEAGERARKDDILSKQAIAEGQTISSENIARGQTVSAENIAKTQSDARRDVAGIGAKASTDVADIGATSASSVAGIMAKSDSDVANITTEANKIIAEGNNLSAEDIANIRATAARDIADIQAQADTTVAGMRNSTAIMIADSNEKIAAGQNVSAEAIAAINESIAAAHDVSAETIANIQKDIAADRNASNETIATDNNTTVEAVADIRAAAAIANIAAQGDEQRATQEPRLLLQRQEATGEITGTRQASMAVVREDIFNDQGNVAISVVNGLIGLERHQEIIAQFSDEDGNMTDVAGYEEAILQESFAAAVRDPNAYNSATGNTDSSVTLGFRRQGLEDRQVDLAEKSQLFNEKVVEAQLTGIWEAYGVEEFDAFKDTYNLSRGDEGFNSRYDFNNDGIIDFSDSLEFSKAVAVGGIETMAMQNLRAATEQFDITTAEGIRQFDASVAASVTDGNLNRAQERFLTAQALASNEFIISEGLDVERMLGVMELLSSDAIDEFSDPEIEALVDIILDEADVSADSLEAFGLNHAKRTQANNLAEMFDDYNSSPDSYSDGFMGIDSNDMTGWYDIAILEIGNISPEKRNAWLEIADVDGDGDLTEMDKFYFTVMTP